ncbi:MAG: hypothetical protein EU549_03225 [Promethearchaeota archaeon]|nr:MAG: hypothetical protein EU549_03225 [Candidatus Lokiarchaeota archaeon]
MKFSNFKRSYKVCDEKCANYHKTKKKLKVILDTFLAGFDYHISCDTYSYAQKSYGADVRIYMENFLIVRQYGKGLTKLAAIVSAYAELIERIQFLYSFFSRNPFKPTLSFPFSKRSQISDSDVCLNQKFDIQIEKNNPHLFKWEESRNKWIEVMDMFNKKKAFLPYRFLYNSSGTAAGNSYSEAFIQGLCEVFERYCVGTVLMNQIKCPTIPFECFNSRNQHLLRLLENDGITIYIKDFSLNREYPTIGLLCDFKCRNENNRDFFEKKQYHLQAGSATSMDKALERTLTELFQVIGHFNDLSIEENAHQKRISKIYSTFSNLNHILPEKASHCLTYIKKAFISDNYLKILLKDSGNFKSWSYYDKSDCAIEVRNLLALLKKNQYHLYLMDYSWLRFISLLVIVPELHFGYNELLYESSELINFKKKIIFSFEEISKSDLDILKNERTILNVMLNPTLDKFLSIEVDALKSISTWIFLGLVAKAFGMLDIAKKYFSQTIPYEIDQLNLAISLKKPNQIKEYFFKLLPRCNKSCEACVYQEECQYYITKDLQNYVAKSYPSYFRLHTKYNKY